MVRALLALALTLPLPALAQGSLAGPPRKLAGTCGAANWVCVAECIDRRCADQCLAHGCEEALDQLALCTRRAGCRPDDEACAERTCGRQCRRAFEPAPRAPVPEKKDPCQGQRFGPVPEELVGDWTVQAASIPADAERAAKQTDAVPRADYERRLRITPDGCFVFHTGVEDATLGRGNALDVRLWGALRVDGGGKRVRFDTQDGQAVGPVCGEPRVVELRNQRFVRPSFAWSVDQGALTLEAQTPDKQTYQLERSEQQVPEEAPPPSPAPTQKPTKKGHTPAPSAPNAPTLPSDTPR